VEFVVSDDHPGCAPTGGVGAEDKWPAGAIPNAEFDRGFVHHETGDYRYFLGHFDAAQRLPDPMIREFASAQVPRLEEDQAKIEQLQSRLGRT